MTKHFEDSWYLRFHGLMPYRVRVILLVASPYDAFTMEEDGRLMTRLFHEYSELNLSELPTIIRAYDAEQAFELLRSRRFDLVITMENLADMDVGAFADRVKSEFSELPIIMFAFTDGALTGCDGGSLSPETKSVDRVFLWTGDANVLIAAIKVIEDQINVVHDTSAGVRVILVVEDSLRYFTHFVSLLYVELFRQAGSLLAEGINDLHKSMRLRSRPKVLLASCYEDACEYFEEYRHNILAVITDVRYPRAGQVDPKAGFALAEMVKNANPDIPIMIQSAEPNAQPQAHAIGAMFGNKGSDHLLRDIQRFLTDDLGFGDFIFRRPDRTEIGRAKDMFDMEKVLPDVPDEVIAYHAQHNHFSTWLMARGMFMLARELRPRKVEGFDNVDGLRQHLIAVLRKARRQEQMGAISDFTTRQAPNQAFVRLGSGSIGGKGRAIAFVNSILRPQRLSDRFDDLRITVPQTVAIGTDEFERFVDGNNLLSSLDPSLPDEATRKLFIDAPMAPELARRLALACADMTGPLAVRSSSILEDSRQRPFAGVYSTFMLPNNHPDPDVRMAELLRAVKAVYASIFCQEARAYIANTPYTVEEERMGVVIQPVVGRDHGRRFYPLFSGVGHSYNFYPVAGQIANEGVVSVAMGLGKTVVDGGRTLQFSPYRPRVLPQFTTARDFLSLGQSEFFALDLEAPITDFASDRSNLLACRLTDAEGDGTLEQLASVYSPEDDTVRDNLRQTGPRVITFNNILRWQTLPFADAMQVILETMRAGFGQSVEIEFAVDRPASGPAELNILQVRPQAGAQRGVVSVPPDLPNEAFLCRTDVALGNGVFGDIRDVVYVKRDFLDEGGVRRAALDVARLNDGLGGRRYVLIGPGRWGSSDPHLGIPVVWSQIAGAQIIVETDFEGRAVEPSQGSHFFHNVLSMQLGYLTLSTPEQRSGRRLAELDQDWLDAVPAVAELATTRHIRLEAPLTAYLDGRTGSATVLKPGWPRGP